MLGKGGGGLDKPKPDHVVEIGGTEPKERGEEEIGVDGMEEMGWLWRRNMVSIMFCWNC